VPLPLHRWFVWTQNVSIHFRISASFFYPQMFTAAVTKHYDAYHRNWRSLKLPHTCRICCWLMTDVMSAVSFSAFVSLGGLVVSVLAIQPKVRGFKPCRERWTFNGDKNPKHYLFGGEVKPSAPCRKILRHVKETLRAWQEIFRRQNSRQFLAKFLPSSLPDVSTGNFQRGVVDDD
jgi:hypothetical protein